MAPRSIPNRCAVSGWISTHELQQILVTGSGSSRSHGLFAPRPSPRSADGYVTTKKSPVPPIGVLGPAATAAGAVRAVRVAVEMPFGRAAASAGAPPAKFATSQERKSAAANFGATAGSFFATAIDRKSTRLNSSHGYI